MPVLVTIKIFRLPVLVTFKKFSTSGTKRCEHKHVYLHRISAKPHPHSYHIDELQNRCSTTRHQISGGGKYAYSKIIDYNIKHP